MVISKIQKYLVTHEKIEYLNYDSVATDDNHRF